MGHIGLSSTQSPADADVIVLNSCVVRQSAEDRVTGMLGNLRPIKERSPETVVALMGCNGRSEDDQPGAQVSSSGRFHAPAAVSAFIRPAGRPDGHRPRGLHGQPDGQAGRRRVRPDHPRVRQVLLLLYHPIQAWPGGQPHHPRHRSRGGAPGGPGSQRGDPARTERGLVRARPSGGS